MEGYQKFLSNYTCLRQLREKYGASAFGRVCQLLFGLTLKELGFEVRCQESGRPDLIAERRNENYTIEVKTSTKFNVTVEDEDKKGVVIPGNVAVLAILFYPSPEPKWNVVNLQAMPCGRKIPKASVYRWSIQPLETEANEFFPSTIKKYFEIAMRSVSELRSALKSETESTEK